MRIYAIFLFTAVAAPLILAQAPNPDTATFEKDGSARITRVIPLPEDVSSEARALLATGATWAPDPADPLSAQLIERARRMYPVAEEEKVIAGVKTRLFTPRDSPARAAGRLLINLHVGGSWRIPARS